MLNSVEQEKQFDNSGPDNCACLLWKFNQFVFVLLSQMIYRAGLVIGLFVPDYCPSFFFSVPLKPQMMIESAPATRFPSDKQVNYTKPSSWVAQFITGHEQTKFNRICFIYFHFSRVLFASNGS